MFFRNLKFIYLFLPYQVSSDFIYFWNKNSTINYWWSHVPHSNLVACQIYLVKVDSSSFSIWSHLHLQHGLQIGIPLNRHFIIWLFGACFEDLQICVWFLAHVERSHWLYHQSLLRQLSEPFSYQYQVEDVCFSLFSLKSCFCGSCEIYLTSSKAERSTQDYHPWTFSSCLW